VNIDHEARKRLAELARWLAVARISNEEFAERWRSGSERALHDVFFYGLWPLYDDFTEHRLLGRWALTPEARKRVARIVLFLRSGQPYRYKLATGVSSLPALLLSVVTLGWFGRVWLRRRWKGGNESVWPFFSREEYAEALCRPVYLSGHSRQGQLSALRPRGS
jgi:hypothetical protein